MHDNILTFFKNELRFSRNAAVMSTFVELLIFGYISSIQSSLGDNRLIPRDIYRLCLLFYKQSLLILWSKGYDVLELGVLDVDDQKLITLDTPRLKKCMTSYNKYDGRKFKHSMCHITNFRYNKETFNGIFGIVEEGYASDICYPYLCLYDLFTKQTKYEFLSTQHLTPKHAHPKQFLFLKDKQCIIYEWKGKLYQMKLNDVKVADDLSKFTEIKPLNRINMFFAGNNDNESWLQMVYLPEEQYLFCVKCYKKSMVNSSNKSVKRLTAGRIFDLEENKWSQIEYYKHWSTRKDRFETHLLCYDNKSKIFMIDMEYNLCYYDLDTLKWTTVKKLDALSETASMWMTGNHVLNRYEVSADRKSIILMKLDLLTENTTWIKESTVDEIGESLTGIHFYEQPYLH